MPHPTSMRVRDLVQQHPRIIAGLSQTTNPTNAPTSARRTSLPLFPYGGAGGGRFRAAGNLRAESDLGGVSFVRSLASPVTGPDT